MTLHSAIEQVLRESRRPMKSAELAEIINSRKLYVKSDNTNVSPSQITARVSKYQDLFKIGENGIVLHDLRIKPYRDFMLRFTNMLRRMALVANEMKVQELTASFLGLIYLQERNSQFPSKDGKYKKDLIAGFRNLQNEHPQLEDAFQSTIDFIANFTSEFEVEQIVTLVNSYRFESAAKPLQDEFSSFFNDALNAFNWKNNFKGGEYSTPKLISLLISSIYELPLVAKIFDPFAGRASLLSELIRMHKNSVQEVLAGDINQNSVNLGSLNLYSTGLKNFDYRKRNAFGDWERSVQADLIISNPPFGGRLEDATRRYPWQMQPTSDLSLNAIQMILYHLSDQGKAIIIVPESVLFAIKREAAAIRAMLVNEDILQGIVLLPKYIFKPYATVSSAILIFDKSRKSKSTGVFFYDASEIPLSEFSSDIINITDTFHNEISIKDKARWVPKFEIETHQYDLTVKKYLLQSMEGEEHVPLRNLVKDFFTGSHVSADNINKEEGIPYIQVGDLFESEGLETIAPSKVKSFISDAKIVGSTIKQIPDQSILISKVGTKLKPTLFEGVLKVVASSNIIVLHPGPNVLPEYLVSQLQSNYVQKQVEVIRRYNAIPNFNLRDLLNIKIKKLPIEQQHQYVATYYSRKVTDIEKSEVTIKEVELYNIISRIKHEVKQPVSSIGIDIIALTDYLKQKETNAEKISLDDYAVEPLPGQTTADIENSKVVILLNRIIRCVGEAQDTLRKAEETINIGKAWTKLEPVEIKHFIEKIVKPLYVNENCVIKLTGKEQTIKADKYQLKVLFKHLIENAIKHGFISDNQKEQNIIKIELDKDTQRGFAEVIVMNNGKPLSHGFNKSYFETMGATGNRDNGSGFGGYHIKRIIENHNGEFQIANEEDVQFSEFKVKFRIYLPLII